MSKKFDFIVHQRICSHEKNAPLFEAVLLQGEAKNYSIVHVLSDRIRSISRTTVVRWPQTCHEGMLVLMIHINFIATAGVIGPFDQLHRDMFEAAWAFSISRLTCLQDKLARFG